MKIKRAILLILMVAGTLMSCTPEGAKDLNLTSAKILISPNIKSNMQETSATVLIEEIEKRTGISLEIPIGILISPLPLPFHPIINCLEKSYLLKVLKMLRS